jgi:NAD(P)-dependent dehydrogenase (short-subunit alcohol dehydrogenase family)
VKGREIYDLQLKQRRVLVTGSRSGIGKGIARMMAAQGAAVVVHGRNRARRCGSAGSRCWG